MSLKEYSSCFIGIPLPQEYQQGFEDLLRELGEVDSSLELTDPKTPHITGYYLDEQSQLFLPKIAESVREKIHLLKDAELTKTQKFYF